MWWKTFSAVFVATLAALLITFAVYKNDQEKDRAAAWWDAMEKRQEELLSQAEVRFRAGEPVATDERDPVSLRWSINAAEDLLKIKPPRARNGPALVSAIEGAKDTLAGK